MRRVEGETHSEHYRRTKHIREEIIYKVRNNIDVSDYDLDGISFGLVFMIRYGTLKCNDLEKYIGMDYDDINTTIINTSIEVLNYDLFICALYLIDRPYDTTIARLTDAYQALCLDKYANLENITNELHILFQMVSKTIEHYKKISTTEILIQFILDAKYKQDSYISILDEEKHTYYDMLTYMLFNIINLDNVRSLSSDEIEHLLSMVSSIGGPLVLIEMLNIDGLYDDYINNTPILKSYDNYENIIRDDV